MYVSKAGGLIQETVLDIGDMRGFISMRLPLFLTVAMAAPQIQPGGYRKDNVLFLTESTVAGGSIVRYLPSDLRHKTLVQQPFQFNF